VSVAAALRFVSRVQPLEAPNGQLDGSLDAVVCTGALGRCADPEAMLREAGRALKPGAPLIFVEDMSGSTGQGVFEALKSSSAARELFEPAQYDEGWATLPLLPVVGRGRRCRLMLGAALC
jgi:SAM-dependent methyltransferase